MPRMTKEIKKIFDVNIPNAIRKQKYFDFSSLNMLLEDEIITGLSLAEHNEPDEYLIIAENIITEYLENNPLYLMKILSNNPKFQNDMKKDKVNFEIIRKINMELLTELEF